MEACLVLEALFPGWFTPMTGQWVLAGALLPYHVGFSTRLLILSANLLCNKGIPVYLSKYVVLREKTISCATLLGPKLGTLFL